jgi:hypothetical protein
MISGKWVRTTVSDKATARPLDLVNRQFRAHAVMYFQPITNQPAFAPV